MEIRKYVTEQKASLAKAVATLAKVPQLVILQVNDDPASNTYIKGKLNDAEEVGINAKVKKLPITTTEAELLQEIEWLNEDKEVDGFIVQMPLPTHINEEKVKLAVQPAKDIDGFHPLSHFKPCTPYGIIKYLKAEGINLTGQNAVVIGRSNIVGKPMAKLLLEQNANVTVLHSRTSNKDLRGYLANADIIVVAVGRKYFIDETYQLKEDTVIVDVGINKENGVTYGDVQANLKVKLQTPVPGGVGLLTRLTLLENLLEAIKNGI